MHERSASRAKWRRTAAGKCRRERNEHQLENIHLHKQEHRTHPDSVCPRSCSTSSPVITPLASVMRDFLMPIEGIGVGSSSMLCLVWPSDNEHTASKIGQATAQVREAVAALLKIISELVSGMFWCFSSCAFLDEAASSYMFRL